MSANPVKVKEVQAKTGCSLSEARRIVIKLDLIERAEKAPSLGHLKTVVKDLIIEVLK